MRRVNGSSTDIASSTAHDSSEPASGARIVWDVPSSPRPENGVEEKEGMGSSFYKGTGPTNFKTEPDRPINFGRLRPSAEVGRMSSDTIEEIVEGSGATRVESRKSRPRSRSRFGAREKSSSRLGSRRDRSRSASPRQAPYLSYTPSIGRNSQFYDLTEEQRNELGGIEYRSLKTLSWILVGETTSCVGSREPLFTYAVANIL